MNTNIKEEGGHMPKVAALQEALGSSWEVREGDRSLLVETMEQGINICVDGRPPKGKTDKQVRGPKVQGGTLGVAMLVAVRDGKGEIDEESFREACEMTVDSGFLPGVHDLSGEHVHCGACALHQKEYYGEGTPNLVLEPSQMVDIVKEYGGQEVELEGEHVEEVVRLNYVKGTTLEPNYDAFGLDAWWIEQLGLDVDFLLSNAARTVVGLNGPQVIEVIE